MHEPCVLAKGRGSSRAFLVEHVAEDDLRPSATRRLAIAAPIPRAAPLTIPASPLTRPMIPVPLSPTVRDVLFSLLVDRTRHAMSAEGTPSALIT